MITGFNEQKGEESEWNEGNYKSFRLHIAQSIINNAKMQPFKKIEGEWNFKNWFNGIVVLFEEGMQKYSPKEYDEVKKLKEEVLELIEANNICSEQSTSRNKIITFNAKKWKELKEKIETFEYKAKYYNDQHGLSTRNVKGGGLF